MPALAVTEQGNFYSVVKFYRLANKYGVKPIIGAELRIINDEGVYSGNIVLLCQNQTGYQNLTELITKSYLEGQTNSVPYTSYSWLKEATEGLLALSCAREGNIGQALINDNYDLAKTHLAGWLGLFPERFYLELQRTGRQNEDRYIQGAVDLAGSFSVPVVASNDVRFLNQDDFEAHEARVCIQYGTVLNDKRRIQLYSDQQFLKSNEAMLELFRDIPEAVENTIEIAKRCNLELTLGEYYLPGFPVPDGHDQNSWLRHESERGLSALFEGGQIKQHNPAIEEIYSKRLNLELEVIINMGFPGYFLIVADFIRWAKEQDIPVGPGRGSGAGSLVAYALDITELDPIQYDLLFERFLNPERVSLPDFDVDFCMDRRDEVIDYVARKYGRDHVSQIITFGSMAAKAVVRDVGRVLGHPYGFVDQIAKLIPFEINMTLSRALDEEAVLQQRYKEEEEVQLLIDLAKKLEGLARNAGKHAGGIVIAPKSLTEYMPLYCEQGSSVTSTQFDMGDVEAIGLVKFDFLGLRTLTIIDWAVKDVNQVLLRETEEKMDIRKIPLDDKKTLALIRNTDTTAIFQLESIGIKKLIKRLQPDTFNDLIALVALFRPGPLQSGMVDDYIDRKHGRAVIQYPHPSLESVLSSTRGVILYQEQVMQIAQLLAGYTLGAADLLRRAMGKKKPEEMAKQRNIFIEGAVANGVEERVASYIFDLMEKFAGYGFNKSHSAAYALLAYQTAWLKAHYPAAFMAAVLSSDMDNTDKIVTLREELRRMKTRLLPPSVNDSEYKFKVIDKQTIRFGLGAIKGVGSAAIDNILYERNSNGSFDDLFDLCRRVDLRKVNKRVYEALIRSGAADDLGPGRSVMMASLTKAVQLAEQHTANRDTGQDDMFGLEIVSSQDTSDEKEDLFSEAEPWTDEERLSGEKETLGFYLEGHPIIRYEEELASIITCQLKDIKPGSKHINTVAGYIESIRTRPGRSGRTAEILIDDRTARIHMTLNAEIYQQYRNMVLKDKLVIVRGLIRDDDYFESGCSITGKELFSLDQYRAEAQARLRIRVSRKMLQNGLMGNLKTILTAYGKGENPVVIEYNNQSATGTISFGAAWTVDLNEKLLDELTVIIGEENIKLDYSQRIMI